MWHLIAANKILYIFFLSLDCWQVLTLTNIIGNNENLDSNSKVLLADEFNEVYNKLRGHFKAIHSQEALSLLSKLKEIDNRVRKNKI